MRATTVNPSIKKIIRENFARTYILSGGYDAAKAEHDLLEKNGDLVVFGKLFISNPNLVEKLKRDSKLQQAENDIFFTLQAKGVILIIQQSK